MHRKTNFLVNLYWDNKYSDSDCSFIWNKEVPGTGLRLNFLSFRNDIGTLLVHAINESFRKESLSSPQKEGLITLLPKGDKLQQLKNKNNNKQTKTETSHAIKCVI